MTHISMQTAADHEEIQALVGRAIIDPQFCEDLLNGHRAECLAEFPLSAEELGAAAAIKADDLAAYAAGLQRWIHDRRVRSTSVTLFTDQKISRQLAAAA